MTRRYTPEQIRQLAEVDGAALRTGEREMLAQAKRLHDEQREAIRYARDNAGDIGETIDARDEARQCRAKAVASLNLVRLLRDAIRTANADAEAVDHMIDVALESDAGII